MSGTRPSPAERHLSEQHLGDRLSALVDGELGHETRERVLAHLATCARCRSEADAQRRLKNVFAEAAPPPPSESFLARLQGLPGGGDPGDRDGGSAPFGRAFEDRLTAGPDSAATSGVFPGPGGLGGFGATRGERFAFGYVPARPHTPAPAPAADRGFRIHDVSRHDADRSSSRGLRFAFVAAGAVSLAAIALGGVTTGAPADTDVRGAGSNVTPMRTPSTGAATNPDGQRRRGVGPLLAQGQRVLGDFAVAPTTATAPLLPGVPAPARQAQTLHSLTTPVLAGAAVMSPLIRPLTTTPPLTLTSWPTAPDVVVPDRLTAATLPATAVPDATSSPTASELPRAAR